MLKKSDVEKITGAKQLETRKGTEKMPFRRKSGDPDFHGRRNHAPKVVGNHGPGSPPATMGQGRWQPWAKAADDDGDFPPFGSHFLAVFRAFFDLLSPVFFLTFFLIYWLDSPGENLTRSHANQSTKFPIFWKSRRLYS